MSDPVSLELALEMGKKERKKERKNEKTLIFYIAGSGIPDCFHGCVGAC